MSAEDTIKYLLYICHHAVHISKSCIIESVCVFFFVYSIHVLIFPQTELQIKFNLLPLKGILSQVGGQNGILFF